MDVASKVVLRYAHTHRNLQDIINGQLTLFNEFYVHFSFDIGWYGC